MPFQIFLFAPAAYLLGSIPFGKLIARKVARIDITRRGSGNIGATNVARELSLKWGLLTLGLDVLKGLVPVLLFSYTLDEAVSPAETGAVLTGLASLAGHQFSIFLRFRGGKGVGTALGVFLAIAPLSCVPALLVFVAAVYRWNYVSLASMVSVWTVPVFLALTGGRATVILGAALAAALICLRHRENIHRLIRGDEPGWRPPEGQRNRSRRRSSSSSE
ncbi:MAG: acyl-phosphate glycerol 3-phosphate acyltransferase [Deltaproteobacteria bacterium]|nr:MAG: acyl-phosphate glycerol 3-phosphate acyltransferase [Deltaproteobacteria bacterium]